MTNLQRLLLEGEFVGTYKYALLISLSRWAVENPDWDEREELEVGALAPHFLELYWPQAKPFRDADAVEESAAVYAEPIKTSFRSVLVQDRGQQEFRQAPRMLKEITRSYEGCGGNLAKLDAEKRRSLERSARRTIREMPLWKLQNLRSSQVPAEVLYRRGSSPFHVRFVPGVIGGFRHFAPLVEELARAAWLRHVLRVNPTVLGAVTRVESFLFPDSRSSLMALRGPLLEMQGETCFYCREGMRGDVAVDHFLPWARYRRDLGHNFVLAHSSCNGSKSDSLPALLHLERWAQRNHEFGADLAQRFDLLRFPHDVATTQRDASSLYELAEAEGADLWIEKGRMQRVSSDWRQALVWVG
ncbi:MAG: HNH endonuclease domain-containing protein [Planctomycetota bacterium]